MAGQGRAGQQQGAGSLSTHFPLSLALLYLLVEKLHNMLPGTCMPCNEPPSGEDAWKTALAFGQGRAVKAGRPFCACCMWDESKFAEMFTGGQAGLTRGALLGIFHVEKSSSWSRASPICLSPWHFPFLSNSWPGRDSDIRAACPCRHLKMPVPPLLLSLLSLHTLGWAGLPPLLFMLFPLGSRLPKSVHAHTHARASEEKLKTNF